MKVNGLLSYSHQNGHTLSLEVFGDINGYVVYLRLYLQVSPSISLFIYSLSLFLYLFIDMKNKKK